MNLFYKDKIPSSIEEYELNKLILGEILRYKTNEDSAKRADRVAKDLGLINLIRKNNDRCSMEI